MNNKMEPGTQKGQLAVAALRSVVDQALDLSPVTLLNRGLENNL
jgi:hypothetical protein